LYGYERSVPFVAGRGNRTRGCTVEFDQRFRIVVDSPDRVHEIRFLGAELRRVGAVELVLPGDRKVVFFQSRVARLARRRVVEDVVRQQVVPFALSRRDGHGDASLDELLRRLPRLHASLRTKMLDVLLDGVAIHLALAKRTFVVLQHHVDWLYLAPYR